MRYMSTAHTLTKEKKFDVSILLHGCMTDYNSNHVTTTIALQYLDLEKKLDGNYKDFVCCFQQILQAKPHKTAIISHLANHPRQDMPGTSWRSKNNLISDILLWTPTHRHTSIDGPAKNLHSSALCRHWMSSKKLTKIDG